MVAMVHCSGLAMPPCGTPTTRAITRHRDSQYRSGTRVLMGSFIMRYTVIDAAGTMSFIGPCHALKMMAAACSRDPVDHRELLALTAKYDARLTGAVLDGLSLFDEHNSPANATATHARLSDSGRDDAPPFRVVDDVTRRRSLDPVRAGLIVFNLPAKRIVQVQNAYDDLKRDDRGRIRRDGKPTRAFYHYALPGEWAIVP